MIITSPKAGDRQISSQWLGWVERCCRKLIRFDPKYFHTTQDAYVTTVTLKNTSDAVIYPGPFTIKQINGVTVTVYGGRIRIGSSIYTVADTNVTCSQSSQIIAWRFGLVSKQLSIVNIGPTWNISSDYIEKPLWLINGNGKSCHIEQDLSRNEIYPGLSGDV